jgi:hypothetical protein
MIWVHDEEIYVPCELEEANRLFTADGEYAYFVSETRKLVPVTEWIVKCYGENHDGHHYFRRKDVEILKLVPCKLAECSFNFKLQWMEVDEISIGAWVVVPTDLTDLGNIDFDFPDVTFKATLDKA